MKAIDHFNVNADPAGFQSINRVLFDARGSKAQTIEYDAWSQRRSKSRKEFRSSAAFGPVWAGLDQACRNILGKCGRVVET
jgi:hypothetical protein